MTYQLTSNGKAVLRLTDGAFIPLDRDNRDYAAYLAWLDEGHTPAPADVPAPVIPSVVTLRQARLALLEFGALDAVDAAIAAGSRAGQIEWEFASEVTRSSPLVTSMAAGLGLTEATLDALFIRAAAL